MNVVPVVAACIVENGKVLLGFREKSDSPETVGMWEMLGGRLEEGESPEVALVRELLEEAGILIEVVELLYSRINTYSDGIPYLVLYYYCRVLDFPYAGGKVKWVDTKSKELKNSLPGTSEALSKLITRGYF